MAGARSSVIMTAGRRSSVDGKSSGFMAGAADAADRFTSTISSKGAELQESAEVFVRRGVLQDEMSTQTSCKSLPFTLVFYASFLAMQLFHREVGTAFQVSSALASPMQSGVVPSPLSAVAPETNPAPSTSSRFTQLSDVKSWGDALMYMELTVVPFVWAGGDGGSGAVMGVNQLIGGVRLQQWRLSTVECSGARELSGAYTSFMGKKYNRTCRSLDSAYDSADIAGSRPTDAAILQGAKADSDTGTYTYWIPAGQTTEQALGHIRGLRENRWLSAATSNLRVQYAMYCGQVGYFASVEVDIAMDSVGAFTATVKPSSLPTEVWGKWGTVFADLWFCVSLFWLFIGEMFGLARAAKNKELASHISQFYRLVNCALIFLGAGMIIFFMWMFQQLDDIREELTSIMQVDAASFTKLNDTYDKMSFVAQRFGWNELVAFWYSMLVLVRFFQTFQANERLAIITRSLHAASEDLLHFMLIFMLVFSNFVVGAYFLFGKSLKEWSSIMLAYHTGFRVLMGEFDFDAMYLIAPATATVWFVVYIGLIFLLMVNMLLAIVMDAYATAKADAKKSENLLQLVRRQFRSRRTKTGLGLEEGASPGGAWARRRPRAWSALRSKRPNAKLTDDAEDATCVLKVDPLEEEEEEEEDPMEALYLEEGAVLEEGLPQSARGSRRQSGLGSRRQSGLGSRRQSGLGSRRQSANGSRRQSGAVPWLSSQAGAAEDQLEAIHSKLAALEVAVRNQGSGVASAASSDEGWRKSEEAPAAQRWIPSVPSLPSEADVEETRGPLVIVPEVPGGNLSREAPPIRQVRSPDARSVGRSRLRVRDVA